MEIKRLSEYEDRELLEFIVSNQVRMEQRLFKIYGFLSEKHSEDFHKHNEHKGEAFEEFISSFRSLNQQINEILNNE